MKGGENVEKIMTEMQESVVAELNEAINNLKAGRYEEVYNILTNLSDELTTDIIISKDDSSIKKS